MIKGCLYLEPSLQNADSKRLLKEEYVDPYEIAMAYLKQALDWSAIKQDNCTGLKRLSLFLVKCEVSIVKDEFM